jgi:dTDP-4-dehydrorhamnose reductase
MILRVACPRQLVGIVRIKPLSFKQTVLVTGANGQVGRNICRVFNGSFDVVGFSSRELDVSDAAAIQKIFDLVKPNIVINAAAYTKVDDAEMYIDLADRMNFHAVRYLCDACLNYNSLLVHFSTDYVFDGVVTRPYGEEDRANPLNAYGSSKLAGDKHVIENADQYLIFRLAWVYDNNGTNFPKKILQLAKVKDQLTVVDDQFGTPTSADFIAKTVHQFISMKAVDKKLGLNGLYNLVPNGAVSWFEFAGRLLSQADALGFDLKCKTKDLIPIKSSHMSQPAKRPQHVILDNRKIQRELGIRFDPWDSYINDFLEQLRRQNDKI